MGFLKDDKILSWDEMVKYIPIYKKIGLLQFTNIYNAYKNIQSTPYYWGYETEYFLIKKDENDGNYKLLLKASELLNYLDNNIWKPEYSEWIIEKIPQKPFNDNIRNLLIVEQILKEDSSLINHYLGENEFAITMTNYPLLGVNNFYYSNIKSPFINQYSESDYIPDNTINKHIRFRTLTENIKKRRKNKVYIELPVYPDNYTMDNLITMDCMAFGMGCSSSQITIQCENITHAMYTYDQLAILSPILLSLSASCPFAKGLLSNNDTRWNIISQSVDDRMEKEYIQKSRYSSISTYLHEKGLSHNNITIQYNIDDYNLLLSKNIPENIARHIAHLFVRDPLIMYTSDIDKITQNNMNGSDFFQNINTSNWNNVRFKAPISYDDSWKVELRVFDIQANEFQNSALIIFSLLMIRVISYYQLNLYIPISKLNLNMEKANMINSINDIYYFRSSIDENSKDLFDIITIDKIINGKNGLIKYIYKYLEDTNQKENLLPELNIYLQYIIGLSSGIFKTNSSNMRDFINNHPDYYKDSKLNNSIINDLIERFFIKKKPSYKKNMNK